MNNPTFVQANKLFAGKLCSNKQEGKRTTKHKQSIKDEDLKTPRQYFEHNTQCHIASRDHAFQYNILHGM